MVVYVIDFSSVSKSPLNPLGSPLRSYIRQELHAAIRNNAVTSIVLTGGGPNFSAGADLTEFASAESGVLSSGDVPSLIDIVDELDACTKPVVACIHGVCLGGGLEVALACHYRICTATSKLGLPEVHVGVIPGAGGTQRLPRLVGLQQAVRMILTGAPAKAKQALQIGLVDSVVDSPKELLQKAKDWANWAEVMPFAGRRLSHKRIPEDPATAHVVCHVSSLSIPKNGHSGIRSALDACRASATLPFGEGMQREGELFLQVLLSSEGKARRHNFFATRQAQHMDRALVPHNHPLLSKTATRFAGVVGAGTMGAGIALVLLQAGFNVQLVDISGPALKKGLDVIQGVIQSKVKRKKLKPQAAKSLLSRLSSSQKLEDLSMAQVVVEAVIENMKIKRSIFSKLDTVTKPDCILLSNTSTLDIDQMAAVIAPSRQFAGWHFFSPAHVMKLVEIVVGKNTSAATVALMQALTKQVGKTGVVVGNCDGFCGNRLLKPYSAESCCVLVENTCSVDNVDKALLEFGMALGPFQMGDLAGNDVGYNIRRERGWVREESSPSIPRNRPPRYTELGDVLISKYNRLGQKAGKGWYDYDPAVGKGRTGLPSAEVDALVQRYRNETAQRITPNGIVERLLFPLVNEGFKCLEEGIARSPGDIDVVYVYGYGK